MENYNNIKSLVDKVLSIESSVRRKKVPKQIQMRELFVKIVNTLQSLESRANIAFNDLHIDLSTFEEPYLELIDALIILNFGKDVYQLISYYVWERVLPDGSILELKDANDNIVPIDTVYDLWTIATKLNPKL